MAQVLYRAKTHGKIGIWYCEPCMIAEGLWVDPVIKDVCNVIACTPNSNPPFLEPSGMM
jgi:hypothetical protein